MHVHLEDNYKNAFPLFLANGVTGVREMGAALTNIDRWKTRIQAGMPRVRIYSTKKTASESM